jgi:hypothetical protein
VDKIPPLPETKGVTTVDFETNALSLVQHLRRIFDETCKIKAMEKIDPLHHVDLIYGLCCAYRFVSFFF